MILVTGGAGYIGSHTCVELLNNGFDILIADNFSNSSPKAIERLEQITSKQIPYINVDIRDESGLEQVFRDHLIDAVIHFAGLKAVGESMLNPLTYFDNNIAGTVTLLKVMQKFAVKIMIFSSSATVYGEENSSPYQESMPTHMPNNNYGYTKLVIEQMLQKLSAVDSKSSIALLRYFNPIGAHPTGLIGEHPKGIPNNLLPYVTQVAVGLREKLSIFGGDYATPDGTAVRDYLHVVDLAVAHVLALKNRLVQQGCEIWNVGTGTGYSVLDIKNTFEEVNQLEIPFEIVTRREGDLPSFFADPSKIQQELGWQVQYQLKDMLAHSWNWQKNNPNGYE